MSQFYILSLKWTKKAEPYVTFWGPNNGGYRWALCEAGRYAEDQIEHDYHNDGTNTLAVPCDVVDRLATEGCPQHMDRRADMRVVKNNAVNMKHLKAMALRRPAKQAA